MPENPTPVTELTSQYVSQVTSDLERNLKEQDRVTAEISALQEQLTALRHDHAVLVSMRQALGVTGAAGGAGTAEGPVVPAPRTTSATASAPASGRSARKDGAEQAETGTETGARTAGKPAAEQAAPRKTPARRTPARKTPARKAAAKAPQVTLVELVRGHLAEQSEPRSAAEVTEALDRAHPERHVQTKVIRTALENLVARNQAHRAKQGSSVFYTIKAAPATASPTTEAPPAKDTTG
ncbi:hypothetical protein [Streptomyces sp. NPDC127190]|uniref:hypothetical protein n=1 Tax=unclassified Streptomyces TaxID=2593676 RepID=UPI0036329809